MKDSISKVMTHKVKLPLGECVVLGSLPNINNVINKTEKPSLPENKTGVLSSKIKTKLSNEEA